MVIVCLNNSKIDTASSFNSKTILNDFFMNVIYVIILNRKAMKALVVIYITFNYYLVLLIIMAMI